MCACLVHIRDGIKDGRLEYLGAHLATDAHDAGPTWAVSFLAGWFHSLPGWLPFRWTLKLTERD